MNFYLACAQECATCSIKDLQHIKHRIARDHFDWIFRRGGEPLISGIGVIQREGRRPFLEILLKPDTDPMRLMNVVTAEYRVSPRLVSLSAAPIAVALRSVSSGGAVGHFRCACLGTAGALVYGNREQRWFMLSNSHVLALNGAGRVGDPLVDHTGQRIGRLARSTSLDPRQVHLADAALGELEDGVSAGVSRFLQKGTARIGDAVTKLGASSGSTSSMVVCVDYTLAVQLPTGEVWFDNQIAMEQPFTPVAQPGDSGAVVRRMDADGRVVGLVFAAGQTPTGLYWRGYANHISNVDRALSIG